MPLEVIRVGTDELLCDNLRIRDLDDLVHEQKRRAVGNRIQRHGCGHGDTCSLWTPLPPGGVRWFLSDNLILRPHLQLGVWYVSLVGFVIMLVNGM